jgi:putative proteasome-type protease
MPIDLVTYERDSLEVRLRRRFLEGDADFAALSANWSAGIFAAFRDLPKLTW